MQVSNMLKSTGGQGEGRFCWELASLGASVPSIDQVEVLNEADGS